MTNFSITWLLYFVFLFYEYNNIYNIRFNIYNKIRFNRIRTIVFIGVVRSALSMKMDIPKVVASLTPALVASPAFASIDVRNL